MVVGYLLAVVVVLVALALKVASTSLGADHPFLLLPAAVIIATWYGGRGPGLVATLASAIGADVLFLPPLGLGASGSELFALLVLIAEGALIVVVTGAMRDSQRRAAAHADDADRARRSSAFSVQLRDEFLQLWGQKLSGPLAHILVTTRKVRAAAVAGDADALSASLDVLEGDIGLVQRTADAWTERVREEQA
ncbi:MAG TPA: DUF4118 domain-containing protein [Candidatus Limnocylindrales bacterium]|nr:DUF4118 domain-containing protein [Candidatus Limnocylindrales bacterium]